MSNLRYEIIALLCRVLLSVPIGTRRGIFTLLWALLSGRFLASRGAGFPAIEAMGLEAAEVRRSEAALTKGRFRTTDLVSTWRASVRAQGKWRPHKYAGVRPVSCDLTGFERPKLSECTTKHYTSKAGKAVPALVYGFCVEVDSVGSMRLGVPRLLLRQEAGETEPNLPTARARSSH